MYKTPLPKMTAITKFKIKVIIKLCNQQQKHKTASKNFYCDIKPIMLWL